MHLYLHLNLHLDIKFSPQPLINKPPHLPTSYGLLKIIYAPVSSVVLTLLFCAQCDPLNREKLSLFQFDKASSLGEMVVKDVFTAISFVCRYQGHS